MELSGLLPVMGVGE